MKSITIHSLDEMLDKKLQQQARKSGTSLNKTIKEILRRHFGIHPAAATDHRSDFAGICGVWSRKDAEQFTKRNQDLEKAHPGDWQ